MLQKALFEPMEQNYQGLGDDNLAIILRLELE